MTPGVSGRDLPPPGLDYLGVKLCGCARTWISAKYSTRAQIAKEIAHWIQDGLDVQRVTTDEARRRLGRCPHETPEWAQAQMFDTEIV